MKDIRAYPSDETGNIHNENVTLCCFNSNAKMSVKEFCCITFVRGYNAVELLAKTSIEFE